MQIEVHTTAHLNGDIVQETMLHDYGHEARTRLSAELIRTKDAGIRAALIKLGWTPPKEDVCQN